MPKPLVSTRPMMPSFHTSARWPNSSAWRQAKAQSDVKSAADAAARAHGEPVTILSMDSNSLMDKFRVTFGPNLCDHELPSKSFCEEFEESLAEGCLEAERLSEVVSEEEAQEQRKVKADPARQYKKHLDGKLTLQTRRRFTSVEPTNQEQLFYRTCGSWRNSVSQAVRSSGISPGALLTIT